MFLFFKEGPNIGKKSGNVGLNPTTHLHVHLVEEEVLLHNLQHIQFFFDGGLSRPPSSTVPTALNPCFIGVIPKPRSKNITGLDIR